MTDGWEKAPRAREARQLGGRTPWFNAGWPIRSVAVDPRGRHVLAAGDRGLRLFHAPTGELVRTFTPRPLGVLDEAIAFSADGGQAFAHTGTLHGPRQLTVWDVETGAVVREMPLTDGTSLRAIDVAGARAIRSHNHVLALHDLAGGAEIRRIEKDRAGFGEAAFLGAPATRAVVAAGMKDALVWDLASGDIVWRKEIGEIRSLAAPPDGRWFAAGAGHGLVRLHDAASGALLHTFGEKTEKPYGNDVTSVCVSADGRRVAAIHASRVQAWDVETRRTLLDVRLPHPFYQAALAFDPRGAWVVAAMKEGVLRRLPLDGSSKEEPAPPRDAHAASIVAVAFGADGSVFSSDQTTVLRWDETGCAHAVEPGAAPPDLRAPRAAARVTTATPPPWLPRLRGCIDAEWQRRDPDHVIGEPVVGPTLAANTTHEGTVLVWDLAVSDEPLHELSPGRAPAQWLPARAFDIAIHPGGRLVALATNRDDAPVQLWDGRAGRVVLACVGPEGDATSVAFSPDGAWLAAGSLDRTVRLWRVPG